MPVQPRFGLALDLPERQADRTREVVLLVLRGRKHLDELSPVFEQPPDPLAVDLRWHATNVAGSAVRERRDFVSGATAVGGRRGGGHADIQRTTSQTDEPPRAARPSETGPA